MYADRAYDSEPHREELRERSIDPQVARRRTAHGSGLGVYRWVVERTFAWLGRYRRNSRDYEKLSQTSESMLMISGIQLMLRRLKSRGDAFVFHYPKNQENKAN